VLVDDLRRETQQREHAAGTRVADLFADFNGIPQSVDKTQFYRHDLHWTNPAIIKCKPVHHEVKS
jgi:adenine-specific DNA-methyltransferase